MSAKRPELPAYVRLPDGLRLAGSAQVNDRGHLVFNPKQAISPLPPEGLPVQLTIAGVSEDEDAQVGIEGSIEHVTARDLEILPDRDLPDDLIEVMDPGSIVWLPSAEEANKLLEEMREQGLSSLTKGMRRFLIELGDQLFDLSTSSRYGISGQHAHYDALNALKRGSEEFVEAFAKTLHENLQKTEKDGDGQSFADLEAASARNLDLVALDEMDQKLAIDKIVTTQIEVHRIELECLTIRAALVADLEPRRARTPFHPAYIVQAFTDAFTPISDHGDVLQDALRFFRDQFIPTLDKLYPRLNKIFVDAGIEPGLEDDIRENGSLLNPIEKRIIKSAVRTRDQDASVSGPSQEGQAQRGEAETAGGPGTHSEGERQGAEKSNGRGPGAQPGQSRDKHDAMYDAVISALDTSRGVLPESEQTSTDYSAEQESTPRAETAATSATSIGDTGGATTATGPSPTVINQEQLLSALLALQTQQPKATSLGDLPSLESLVQAQASPDGESTLDREGANRLGFVDNVFRTLHNNFEVSSDMAPSLAKLRVPLARLSLQEPRFFTQPEHPAHQVLDKLSLLASTDHTVNKALQSKVAKIVERIADDYQDDNSVFATAQDDLDKLVSQKDRLLNRNIERVISGLEGQERLIRAQRRVEQLLETHMDRDNAPAAVLDLLEKGGWRSALVQLALREGEDSVAWREEAALLESLLSDVKKSTTGDLDNRELREMQLRLRALNSRLQQSNPGSVAHEAALNQVNAVLAGQAPLATGVYQSPVPAGGLPQAQRVEQLPRLRRWMQRVQALEPGARLRYRDKDGRRRHMRLVWVSDDRDRYAFVNERGQKIAELTAVQLARQLSRGAQPPTPVDNMSVLNQSMYETLEEAQKTLSFDRNRDSLTQLINGESLLFQLRRSLRHAQTRGSEHAFMLLDIDNFALVNEVFDETSGDEVLSEFAKLLGQLNDRRALTARMEEDEFGILLTYRNTEEARQVADKIRQDISQGSLSIAQEPVSFTVSIGIAAVAQASASAEAVLKQARSALKIAKDQGRDQVVVFDIDQQEVHEYRSARAESRRQLEEAMSTDGLVLRAQPIAKSAVDGSEGATHHFEVLLSLRDEDGNLQSPQEFIMSAERFGYVTLVDRWVLKETFAWISQLMDAQKEVPELSINLSGTSITDNDFLDYVLEQISEYGVGTSKLCFEITETGAIDNLPRAADFVRTLKNIGCKFSLDDFGTGLASHKYLKELPVDYVKIDGTFITEVHNNPTDFAMAKSINDLAHFLGQKTIAECVENLDIVPALREIGIDYLQGWGIGHPRELHEIAEDLANLET